MRNQVVEGRFSEFFERWIGQLEENLQLLKVSRESSNETEQAALVSRVTTHIKEYYTVKWAMAHEDVLVFYCPVWISTLETAYFWFTGWKPSTVFRLVESMRKGRVVGPRLEDLTELQLKGIEELRLRIRLEEEKVERDMERQQMALADRKTVELARLATQLRSGALVMSGSSVVSESHVDGLVELALKNMMNGLERVMKGADCVRLKTLKGILDILNSKQSVEFLAGNYMLQLQLRQWGKKRDDANEHA